MAKKKLAIPSDVYTAILALALLAIAGTTIFVAVKCGNDYGWSSLFQIVQASAR